MIVSTGFLNTWWMSEMRISQFQSSFTFCIFNVFRLQDSLANYSESWSLKQYLELFRAETSRFWKIAEVWDSGRLKFNKDLMGNAAIDSKL
jgi:hypothetical protein